MAKKKFTFEYDENAKLAFVVDLDKFTPELANETLNFFLWDFDPEADPIEEVMKKYALEVFRIGQNHSCKGIVRLWDQEGFARIDGSMGVELIEYEPFEFLEQNLEMEVKNES